MQEISDLPALPARPGDGHKGTFGTLLILGGSREMIGAPMLAARSALRAGCGLVRVAMPQGVLASALSTLPEAVGLALGDDAAENERRFAAAVAGAEAVVAGPGLGADPGNAGLLRLIYASERPAVIDADALNLLAGLDHWPSDFAAPAVLTPHPGEMARLLKHLGRGGPVPTDEAGRVELAGRAARMFNCTLVLKGHRSIVSDGIRYRVNHTGDNTLAKAGTGDVLSGLIGALLASGMAPFDAACAGAHYHGLAGESAGREATRRGALAGEVADRVAGVMPAG